MNPDLLARLRDSLQLNGLSVKTQDAYLRAVRLLCAHSGCAPDQITEEYLRRYFLYRRNESRWSPSVGPGPPSQRAEPCLRFAARPQAAVTQNTADLPRMWRRIVVHRHGSGPPTTPPAPPDRPRDRHDLSPRRQQSPPPREPIKDRGAPARLAPHQTPSKHRAQPAIRLAEPLNRHPKKSSKMPRHRARINKIINSNRAH